MPSTINWLHLSDLHMGFREMPVWWDMERELKKSIHENFQQEIDMILITGDLTFEAKPEQFELFDAFLGRLLGWLSDAGQKEKPLVIPVPGNHDLVRLNDLEDREVTDRFSLFENFWTNRDHHDIQSLRKTLWETRSPKYFDPNYFDPIFGNYVSWLDTKIMPDLESRRDVKVHRSHFPGDLSVFVNSQDRAFTVVGLNSAWIQCDAKYDYKGKVEVFAEQLQFALSDVVDPPFESVKDRLNILLMHHPVDWLSDAATVSFKYNIYIPELFNLCLHGHMHTGSFEEFCRQSGSSRCYFQAPSLFGRERSGRTMGYVWGQMDDAGAVRVWPFKYDRQNDTSVFIWDPAFSPPDRAGYLITSGTTNQRQGSDGTRRRDYEALVDAEFNKVLQKSLLSERSQTSALFRGWFCNHNLDHDPKISKLLLYSEIRTFLRATMGLYTSQRRPDESQLDKRQYSILDKAATCRWLALVSAIADGMDKYDRRVLIDPLIQGMQRPIIHINDPDGKLCNHAENYIKNKGTYHYFIPKILTLIGYMCHERGLTLPDMLNEEGSTHRTDEMAHASEMQRYTGHPYRIEMYINDMPGSYETILGAFAKQGINLLKSSTETLVPKKLAHASLVVTYDDDLEKLRKELNRLKEEMQDCLMFADADTYSYAVPTKT